jgi:hypothetical protein
MPTAARRKATAANVSGSVGRTPKIREAISRLRAREATRPMTMPRRMGFVGDDEL